MSKRKERMLVMIVAIAIVLISGGCSRSHLTPSNVTVNLPDEQKSAVFDKTNIGNEYNVTKFVFKDFKEGCVYSLDQKTFLLTENSEKQKVTCYLDCATKVCGKPIAITKTGNYLILETASRETVAIHMKKSKMDRPVIPIDPIAIDDLANEERNSLFELTEE